MTEDDSHNFPPYAPDENLRARKAARDAAVKSSVTTEKPVSFRVARTRPSTLTKHYPRKARKLKQRDPRVVQFF